MCSNAYFIVIDHEALVDITLMIAICFEKIQIMKPSFDPLSPGMCTIFAFVVSFHPFSGILCFYVFQPCSQNLRWYADYHRIAPVPVNYPRDIGGKLTSSKPPHEIYYWVVPLIARFLGPTWGPFGADRTQLGPMLASLTLLSWTIWYTFACSMLHIV